MAFRILLIVFFSLCTLLSIHGQEKTLADTSSLAISNNSAAGFRSGLAPSRLLGHYSGIQWSSTWLSPNKWGVDLDVAYLFFNNKAFPYQGVLTSIHGLKYFPIDDDGSVFYFGLGYSYRHLTFQDREETLSRLNGAYFQKLKIDSKLTNHSIPFVVGVMVSSGRIVWNFAIGIGVLNESTHKGRNLSEKDALIKSNAREDKDLSFFKLSIQYHFKNRAS